MLVPPDDAADRPQQHSGLGFVGESYLDRRASFRIAFVDGSARASREQPSLPFNREISFSKSFPEYASPSRMPVAEVVTGTGFSSMADTAEGFRRDSVRDSDKWIQVSGFRSSLPHHGVARFRTTA
jgi:hypothetical protein